MSDIATIFDLDLTLCEHDQDVDALLERTFDRVGVDRYCSPADLAAVADETPSASTPAGSSSRFTRPVPQASSIAGPSASCVRST